MHTVSLQVFRSFSGEIYLADETSYFFVKSQHSFTRLCHLNFFSNNMNQFATLLARLANPGEVSTDSNSIAKKKNIMLNILLNTLPRTLAP